MKKPIEFLDDFENSESEIKLKSTDEIENDIHFYNSNLLNNLGFTNSVFIPKYSYLKTCIEKHSYLCIILEIPGESKISCRAKMFESNWIITIKGTKIVEENQKEDTTILYSTINETKKIFDFHKEIVISQTKVLVQGKYSYPFEVEIPEDIPGTFLYLDRKIYADMILNKSVSVIPLFTLFNVYNINTLFSAKLLLL